MLNMQNVKDIEITEGKVRTIHDKDSRLIWGRLAYDTKYVGDTFQQTYSGVQLLQKQGMATSSADSTFWRVFNNLTTSSLGNGWGRFTSTDSTEIKNFSIYRTGGFEWANNTTYTVIAEIKNAPSTGTWVITQPQNASDPFDSTSTGGQVTYTFNGTDHTVVFSAITKSTAVNYGLRQFFDAAFTETVDLRLTIVEGDHTSDYNEYIGDNWQPFVGGTASPNPDYPQDIQVVTGEQTVTVSDGVNSEDFTISLGTIELCTIGDYQDYIYKSGGDWYVHKDIGKITLTGSNDEGWSRQTATDKFYRSSMLGLPSTQYARCNYLRVQVPGTSIFSMPNCIRLSEFATDIYISPSSTFADLAAFTTWLSTTQPICYYALATPTDTQITDATLVGQLNAVHEWLTRYGYNATVTGTLPIIINQTNL